MQLCTVDTVHKISKTVEISTSKERQKHHLMIFHLINIFPLQDRLRTLIRLCWSFEAAERPSFAQLVSEFGPGCRLLRRLSTSEPRLDQIDVKALRRLPTLSGRR